ncbi:Uncharacterised protein [Mycobacteroides abscessus subsp. massiliense]|nr:Uncharacterised protein [Mycobacteroides abscessus subsp. massiliense]
MAVYTTQSGLSARICAASVVAVMPVRMSSPANAPASFPALLLPETHTPTSSMLGSVITPARACCPTLPVPQTATRVFVISCPS